jgi:hypothetical protein
MAWEDRIFRIFEGKREQEKTTETKQSTNKENKIKRYFHFLKITGVYILENNEKNWNCDWLFCEVGRAGNFKKRPTLKSKRYENKKYKNYNNFLQLIYLSLQNCKFQKFIKKL